MKKLATAARTTAMTALSKKIPHARFTKRFQVTPCYPDSNKSIHLH